MDLKQKFEALTDEKSNFSREELGFTENDQQVCLYDDWTNFKTSHEDILRITPLFIYLNTYWLNKARFKSNIANYEELSPNTVEEILNMIKDYSSYLFMATDINFHLMNTKNHMYFKLSCNIENMNLDLKKLNKADYLLSIQDNILQIKRVLKTGYVTNNIGKRGINV